jgi:hypothetical protein
LAGYITAYGWDRILAWLFGRGEPPPAEWHVALNRSDANQWGACSEPHPETSYARIVTPNTPEMWLPMRLRDHDEHTSVQNRSGLQWTLQPEILDKWLPITGWALFEPERPCWFMGDLPFPIDDVTYDGPTFRLRPGDIFVAGVWLGSGVAYWEAI